MRAQQTPRTPRLLESLAAAPVVDKNGYPYFVHPLSDGVPRIPPALLNEVVEALAALVPESTDVLLAPEAMGIHLATAVAVRVGKPALVARKRAYGFPGEVEASQSTGYGKAVLHLNDVRVGERVTIIDDVLSTGGTLRALARAVRTAGAVLEAALVVFDKEHDVADLERVIGAPVTGLVRVRVRNGRLEAA